MNTLKNIGIAADHGGYALKQYLIPALRAAGYEVVDFGANALDNDDDFPDYVAPLSKAVAKGEVDRGLAICGSEVGACIVANKIKGVRAALISDTFSARQGVEDDNMNVMCLGSRVIGFSLAWELVQTFLNAHYKSVERFNRRLEKVSALEQEQMK